MLYELNEEQQQVKGLIREFAEERIRPRVESSDEAEELPIELITELGEMGILGITIPEKWHGAGMSYLEYATIIEELSRVDPSIGLTIAAHNSLGMQHIYQFGNDAQREKYLIHLAEGKSLAAWALTEAGSGSDAFALKTKAVENAMGFVINGSKTFITNPNFSDVVVVLARTESTNPRQTVSTFVIEKGNPGYKVGRKLRKLGMRASDTAELHFDNCQVNRDKLLGEMGMGFRQAMQILDGGRISIAAMSVGIAQGAYEAALKYAGEREAFGKKIAHHQSIGNKLAIMATEIEASRLLTMKTAWVFRQEQWHPNSRLLAFASFYGFAPKRCAVRRPQSKGKVERFIGYLTSDFLSQARLEGLKSAAQLNARIGSWLAEITEKKLRDFSESRQQRFAVERHYLQPLTGPDNFDCRDSHDVFVSREGFITFETNSYSVPPIYVGSRLVVKVDRINQEIEIVSNGQSIRTVPMLAPFSKSRYVAREDQVALLKVWQSQRNKPIAIPSSRKKSTVAVEIRQPAYYDALVCERGLS
jgi:alkylation response protein AidB-like acyl-CoA dehydrogenase